MRNSWRAILRHAVSVTAGLMLLGALMPGVASANWSDNGHVFGRVSNLTPYPMTLIGVYGESDEAVGVDNIQPLPKTVEPGQEFIYGLYAYKDNTDAFGWAQWFDATIVYRAQTASGPEDLWIRVEGCHCTAFHGSQEVQVGAYNMVPLNYPSDRTIGLNPLFPNTPNPEIGWTVTDPIGANVQWQIHGDHMIDAAKDPPHLVNVLNDLCAGAAGTKCSFTQTGPITWGIGDPQLKVTVANCTRTGSRAKSAEEPPSELDPNWHRFTVKQARTGSISVGGSLTTTAAVNLFGIIDSEVSVKIGAEHEWSDTQEFEKTTKIFLPSNYIGSVWVAPVLGKVIGTLVVSNPVASYTITNFGQTKSGVSRDLLTPAFNILTDTRPMTAAEYQAQCVSKLKAKGKRKVPRRSRLARPHAQTRSRG